MALAAKMINHAKAIARSGQQAVERRAMQSVTSVSSQSSMGSMFPMPMSSPVTFPRPQKIDMPTWSTTKHPATSVAKEATPLMQVKPNLFAKLEGFNAGGSIKDRAVMQCTVGMLESGKLKPGDTLAVCTSGNAGRSLLHVAAKLRQQGKDINVKIFMPKRYLTRDVPKAIAAVDGVKVVEGDRDTSYYTTAEGTVMSSLNGLDGEFMEVQEKMAALAKEHGWAILDQHYDVNSLHAHESTAQEIIEQLPSVTDVVCTTGTGGTAAGLKHYLPAHVRVHARPGKPGAIDGITDVRRYSNFCDTDLLEGYTADFFDLGDSVDHQKELEDAHNITAGQSSGAAYALAKDIMARDPKAQVVFIAADGKASDAALLESYVM